MPSTNRYSANAAMNMGAVATSAARVRGQARRVNTSDKESCFSMNSSYASASGAAITAGVLASIPKIMGSRWS